MNDMGTLTDLLLAAHAAGDPDTAAWLAGLDAGELGRVLGEDEGEAFADEPAHAPAGSPKGGQFVSKGEGGKGAGKPEKGKDESKPEKGDSGGDARGGGRARSFASRASRQYREAEAAHAAAAEKLKAANERCKDWRVPRDEALKEYAAAAKAAKAAKEKLGDEGRADLVAVYMLGGGGRVPFETASGTRWTDDERGKIQDVGFFLADLLSKDHGDLPRVWYDRPDKGDARAYYQSRCVHVTRASDAGTYAHELGHHLEDVIPGAKDRVREFLAKRCGDEEPVSLREKFARHGFDADERGRADDFGKLFPDDSASAYYVGKVYPSGETEVLSMGLELLWRDPKRFAATDPEYFDLVMDILQPTQKGGG